MAKRGKGGWPRRSRAAGVDFKTDLVKQLVQRLESGTLGEDKLARYLSHLARMLDTWRELSITLPDRLLLEEALDTLTPGEQRAVQDSSGRSPRGRRARAKLCPLLFDEAFLDDFALGLHRALERAQSEEDIGALICGIFSLARTRGGTLRPEDDPLLGLLLMTVFLHRYRLIAELMEAGLLGDDVPSDDQDGPQWFGRALEASPRFRADLERRLYNQTNRLGRLITDGTIRDLLSAEELAPLIAALEPVLRPLVGQDPDDVLAALAGSPEANDVFEAAASDPALAAAFQRFGAALEAQAAEADAAGEGAAAALRSATAFWRSAEDTVEAVRIVVAKASFARLVRSGELALPDGLSQTS